MCATFMIYATIILVVVDFLFESQTDVDLNRARFIKPYIPLPIPGLLRNMFTGVPVKPTRVLVFRSQPRFFWRFFLMFKIRHYNSLNMPVLYAIFMTSGKRVVGLINCFNIVLTLTFRTVLKTFVNDR